MGNHLRGNSEQSGTYASALWAVPSALPGLTSVFGMGTGGAPALDPPAQNVNIVVVFDLVIADGCWCRCCALRLRACRPTGRASHISGSR